ncbi:secretion protein HlyD [Labrys neptuniae]|uniref:Secretion protein HlyD n=1 Tax=Labrys neptuniae TaxID=376174 RepID=A0ABV3PE67_9HYPH
MKKAAIPVVLLAIAGAGFAGWWFDLPQRMGWVERTGKELVLYGNVDIRQVQLGFRVSGRLAETLVDEGDSVKAGDTLARLDVRPYQDLVEVAQAQAASQRATLAKLEAGPRAAEIAQAKAVLAERQADLINAEQSYTRSFQLRPSGTVSQGGLDQAVAARDAARARVNAAREALTLLEQGTRSEDIAAAKASLEAAEANLASARTTVGDATLVAPADGVILSRVHEKGAIFAPNDIAFVLSLAKPVWVRAFIAETDLGRVHTGTMVEVRSDTDPAKRYKGRVGFISPVAEFTPKTVETPELRTDLVYRLRIVVDEPDSALLQGMPVTVRLSDGAAVDGGKP